MAQHGTPTPTDTRGFGPPPSSPARASVRGQFTSAWRRRSPPNWEGAQRGAWFGGLAGLSPISLRCSRAGAAKLVPCGEGRISPAGIAGSICPCRHCHGTELCGARSRFQSRLFARFSSFSTSPFPPEPPRSRDPGALRPHGEGGDVGGGHGAELGVPPTSGSTNAAVGPGAAPAAPQQPPSGLTSGRARVGTKRREEERAKVELTYRWLFKSIKGR